MSEVKTDITPVGVLVDYSLVGKLARTFARSLIVPPMYQNNEANCFVACELSVRMGLSPMFVMQNLIVVQGKPAWSGQACVALINGCGKYRNVRYTFVGEQGSPSWGCRVEAIRQADGERITGTTITMQMATDEGWIAKNGSKWKTMPEQMLKYRAASFFARSEIPYLLMGFSTQEEVADVTTPQEKVTIRIE